LDSPTSSSQAVGPISSSERVNGWDLARGIAVLGILLANMPWMGLAGMLAQHGEYVGERPFDDLAFLFVLFVADSKFVTQFSLLFGAGLAQMRERVLARGRAFTAIGVRRMIALMVAGILHGVFLWFGDILMLYAGLGFLLLASLPRSPRFLAWVGGTLLLVGGLAWLPSRRSATTSLHRRFSTRPAMRTSATKRSQRRRRTTPKSSPPASSGA
jgi:uncharacterized protein